MLQKIFPLNGIRVLDLTKLYPGPLATHMLAEMGAEVFKVEHPDFPDPLKSMPPCNSNGISSAYEALNGLKKCISLKYDQPAEQEAFFKLLSSCDVLVEQFKPGTLAKWGLSDEVLIKYQPQLISVHISGYGQTGAYSTLPGHDINYAALSGLIGSWHQLKSTQNSIPCTPGIQIADVVGGSYQALISILGALVARAQKNISSAQIIDVSITQGLSPLLSLQYAQFLQTQNNYVAALSGTWPNYRLYRCKNNSWVALGALEPKFWQQFISCLGKESEWRQLWKMSDLQHQQIILELEQIFGQKTAQEWADWALKHQLCLTEVLTLDQMPQHPYWCEKGGFDARGIKTPFARGH